MKNIPTFVLIFTLVGAITGLSIFFFFGVRKNMVSKQNSLKREARKNYLGANYKESLQNLKFLTDSLHYKKDAAFLDLAHAGYLSARFDSTGNVLRDIMKEGVPVDTSGIGKMKEEQTYLESLEVYQKLSEGASRFRHSSIAYNQMGVITYNLRGVEPEREDEVMAEAADYFKAALKKDPDNEFARYNYELIRRRIDYPEMIMQQVRSLIHQRKYKEARKLLRNAIEEESRMKRKYGDFMQRIETVISIDSLSRS